MRGFVRKNRESNKFTKEKLINQKKVLAMIDGAEAFVIKGDIENICNFIMAITAIAHNDGGEADFQFLPYKNGDEYLEEVKKTLIPLQKEYERRRFKNLNTLIYEFVAYENDNEVIFSNELEA